MFRYSFQTNDLVRIGEKSTMISPVDSDALRAAAH